MKYAGVRRSGDVLGRFSLLDLGWLPEPDCLGGSYVPVGIAQTDPGGAAGTWVGNRVWEARFGNWKRGRLQHTTCGVKRRSGHTSNSAFPGASGVNGFKLQRLGAYLGFGGRDANGGRGRRCIGSAVSISLLLWPLLRSAAAGHGAGSHPCGRQGGQGGFGLHLPCLER